MKKLVSLVIIVALCLTLCACGSETPEPVENDEATVVEPVETTVTEEKKEYTRLGQEINAGAAKITFTDAKLAYAIGEKIQVIAQDGMLYFGVVGTIENNGGKELPVDVIRAEMVFNDEFTYTARATLGGSRNTTKISVAPLVTAEYWIYAEVPTALLDKLSTCKVRFSLNEDFAVIPETVDKGDYTVELLLDEAECKAALNSMNTASVFFNECPILPTPVNYGPISQTSSSSSSSNGKVTSIKYGFSVIFGRNDNLHEIYNTYISKLQNAGFSIQSNSDTNCDIYADSTKLATVSIESNRMNFNIVPGNENLTTSPSGATGSEAVVTGGDTVVKMGESIETDYISMSLSTFDSASELRSGTSQYGTYTYLYSDNGDPYFYIGGVLKNLGGTPVDIRHIYVQFCFDGKYNYKGSVEGYSSNSNGFINDVSPLASVDYYLYAAVPQELIDTYSTCTVRIGFTKNFDYKVIDVNDLPKFENCDDIFILEITR